MNSKRNLNKWARVTLLLALASFATMGFTVVDRGSRGVTISADHVVCPVLSDEVLSSLPEDVRSHLCLDSEASINPSPVFEVDSRAWSDAYRAALEQMELELNAQFASAAVIFDENSVVWSDAYRAALEQMERDLNAEFVRALELDGDSNARFEQYSAALEQTELLWNQVYLSRFSSRGNDMMARALVTEELNAADMYGADSYGGDWFDVYGDASGLLELELADPQFANR